MRFLVALFLLPLALAAQEPPLPTLTTARELRNLPPLEAARAYPVRLQATVTLVEPHGTVFLRDDTGATFLRGHKSLAQMRSGQRIEVEGETFPGLYVTGIVARRTELLSEGAPPAPRRLSYEELASGQFHYDWVEVEGIVRAFIPGEYPVVKLSLGNGALDLFPVTTTTETAGHLIDAAVRVTGLAAGFINDRRQLVAPHLRLRSLGDIAVLEAAPAEPFRIAATPAAELLRFAPGGRAGHRVKVRGTVMHQEPGVAVWLRDEGQGVRVRSATGEEFVPGEIVEALGFPVMGAFSAELDDAVFQRTGETAEVAPVVSTIKELLSGQRDADLVQVEAVVRDVVREGDRLTLALQAEGTVFLALAQPCPPDTDIPAPGAQVRVTGVCRVAGSTQPARSFSTRPQSFALLLRSPVQDLAVLRRPPWWNAQRLSIAAAALLALALLAFAWAALLRRQVRRQTALIRTQVEEAAIADERQRIAREFHDTLEQELVGVSLRLDAATTRAGEPKLRDLLTATQRLVQQLQTGARSFVWNLRDTALAGQPLAAAISQAVANLAAGRQLEVRSTGEARRLPEMVGHELLRVAQEATTNAVKHGGAQRIAISLDFTPENVRLTVHDDGAGFDPAAPVPAGHFGLLGMRERVQKLGGDLTLRSAAGTGTTVEVTVPLPP